MVMHLSIRELLIGEPNRVRYVTRFSTCRVLHSESVAEHSFFTTLYAMFVARWVNANANDAFDCVNTLEVLESALLHDMEEARTGDVPRFFKYQTELTKDALNQAAEISKAEVWERVFDVQTRGWIFRVWKTAKDNSLEGRIVEFADFLSVLGYICDEVAGANQTIRGHLTSVGDYMKIFEHERFDFIRPLVTQARKLLNAEILNYG